MVQEFHVLRCFSCHTFQVQQVKKSKKWSCKMCGEKQSYIKEYGRGSGADCRRHVQKLNSVRGEILHAEEQQTLSSWEQDGAGEEECASELECGERQQTQGQASRWTKYLSQTDRECEEDEEEPDRNHLSTPYLVSSRNPRKRRQDHEPYPQAQNPWKKAKHQQPKTDHQTTVCSSRKTSPKALDAKRQSSVENASYCADVASASATNMSAAAVPKKQTPVNRASSKWVKFLSAVPDEAKDEHEIALSELDAGHLLPTRQSVGGDQPGRSPVAPICELHSSLGPSPLFSSLFHTDEDFDDTF